ncbi:MAG: STAS domain-containing protein [Actinobacteria bacterium]|nr:STAS domain-containing protein [Actinomycetota bacterium]
MSPRPTPGLLVIAGPIAPGDCAGLTERLAAVLDADEAGEVVICDVREVPADGAALDALARLALAAHRRGRTIRLRGASEELRALITFVGLDRPLGLAGPGDGPTDRGAGGGRRGETAGRCRGTSRSR